MKSNETDSAAKETTEEIPVKVKPKETDSAAVVKVHNKNFATRAKLKRWLYHARRIMLISLLTVYRVAPSTKRLAISNIKQVGIEKRWTLTSKSQRI